METINHRGTLRQTTYLAKTGSLIFKNQLE